MLTVALLAFGSILASRRPIQETQRAPVPAQAPFDSSKYAASADEQREIAKLIEQLVLIDKPDFGLASTMSGTQFAPVESSRTFGSGLIMVDHRIETSPVLRRLVELGPKALPALLKALDDDTPSKLVMEHNDGFGAMWYGREVPINSANPREAKALEKHGEVLKPNQRDEGFPSDTINKHVITRGDIAFVIVGQIVGRGYEAARYQPTACMVINSPSHDRAIAQALRAIWSSDDSARMLFDSLTADSASPACASGATLRLSYYFASDSRAALVQRIDKLDVHCIPWGSPGYEEGWRKQEEANGGSAIEILAAAAASQDSAIVDAVARVIERTDEIAILASCLSASVVRAHADLVVAAMTRFLSQQPANQPTGPYGREYELLASAARLFPDRAQPLFALWLGHGTVECKRSAIHALEHPTHPSAWAVEVLRPLLDDPTDTGWQYGPDYDRHPIRVCDEAAQVLAEHVKQATFALEGDHTNLDRQIEELRRRIAGESVEPRKADAKPTTELEALPVRAPLAAFEIDKIIGKVYSISDAKTLYSEYGWSHDTAAIDVATRRITAVTKIDDWRNDVAAIQPVVGDQILCYHGDHGDVVERELRTGKELRRIATPFHGGDLNSNDPLHIRGWIDMYATADGKWLAAATPDGALHSIDLTTGEHRLVLKPGDSSETTPFPSQLVPVRGTSRFLVTQLGGEGPLRVWDLAEQSFSAIEHVPADFWHGVWGRFAHHFVNEQHELWNLEARKQIPLRLPMGAVISELICDPASATAWIATKDGLVYVVDLNSGASTAKFAASPGPVALARLSLSTDRKWFFFSADRSEYDAQTRALARPETRIAIFDIADLTR